MDYTSLEIKDFKGISTLVGASIQTAEAIENFDLRDYEGGLVLRKGVDLKYNYPVVTSVFSGFSFLNISTFYIPELGGGREITVLVGKGILSSYSLPMVGIWIRPYYDGVVWVDQWQWLNEIKTDLVDSKTNDHLTLDQTYTADSLIGWTAYNPTAKKYATVVKNSGFDVYLSKYNNAMTPADPIYLMRNYIPFETMASLYQAGAGDIVFHKVLNDLRIGFGGYENRIGLSIGYRQKYLRINSFLQSTYTAGEIAKFSTLNGIYLDASVISEGDEVYNLQTATTSGTLEAGTYSFYMTGVLDGFQEVLLASTQIVISTPAGIKLLPSIDFGRINKRLTSLKIYVEKTGVFFLITDVPIYKDSVVNDVGYIDGDGIYTLDTTFDRFGLQNCLADGTDYNSLTGIRTTDGSPVNLSVESTDYAVASYSLKAVNNAMDAKPSFYIDLPKALPKGTTALITFYAKATGYTKRMSIQGDGIGLINFDLYSDWTQLSATVDIEGDCSTLQIKFMTATDKSIPHDGLLLDSVRIIVAEGLLLDKSGFDSLSTQLSSILGYTPTTDVVRGWDEALVISGRVYYVNPYIDKRYANKIMFSHISGAGAFMYDIATAENYMDLEVYDGNYITGIEYLRNMNILIQKQNSIQIADTTTQKTVDTQLKDGSLNRDTSVNMGDCVMWCGTRGIYQYDGLNLNDISIDTIKNIYASSTVTLATKEDNEKSFKFLDTTGKEFVYSKQGWFNKIYANGLKPTRYAQGINSNLYFMDASGNVYKQSPNMADNGQPYQFRWKSQRINIDLLEGAPHNTMFFVNKVYIKQQPGLTYQLKIYMGDTLQLFDTVTITSSQYLGGRMLKNGGFSSRQFQLEIIGTSTNDVITPKIEAIGVMYKLIPIGLR